MMQRFLGESMKKRLTSWVLLLTVAMATLLRFWAASDNFWLDEIMTYYLAMGLKSPFDAIINVKIDHHSLNTFYMALIGDRVNWGWYRLLSVICGSGTIALVMREASQRSNRQALVSGLLTAFSFPLLVYSSEARGYAPAMFFILAALLVFQADLKQRSLLLKFLFWILCVLAFLAQVTAFYVLCGMAAWATWRVVETWQKQSFPEVRREVFELILTFAVPFIALACFYFFTMRKAGSVGGDVFSLSSVLLDTLSYLVGSPLTGVWKFVGASFAVVCVAAGFIIVAHRDQGRFLFYFVSLIIGPLLIILTYDKPYWYPRYFVLCFPVAFLMFGEVVDGIVLYFEKKQNNKSAVAVNIVFFILLMASLFGNGLYIKDFLKFGRGGYVKAMEYMCQHNGDNVVLIAGDHDFRNGLTVDYFARYFRPGWDIRYIYEKHRAENKAGWFIIHSGDRSLQPPQRIMLNECAYSKVAEFPHGGLAGFTWHIYRLDSSE